MQERDFGERLKSTYSAHLSTTKSTRMLAVNLSRCIRTATEVLAGMDATNYSVQIVPFVTITPIALLELVGAVVDFRDFEEQLPPCMQDYVKETAKRFDRLPSSIAALTRTTLALQVGGQQHRQQ